MGVYGTGRPPTERDTLHLLDGSPSYLGCLTSAGSAVDNSTTAHPFNYQAIGGGTAGGITSLVGTLAGKVLMFQPDAAGSLIASSAAIGPSVPTLVVQSSSVVGGGNTICGPLLAASERVLIIMLPTQGWVQWISSSGTANCYVWELV